MKQLLYISMLIAFVYSCSNYAQPIVAEKEVDIYLKLNNQTNKQLQLIETDIRFWSNRFENVKDDLTAQLKLGGLYSRKFQYSGNINDIKKSDSFYLEAHKLQKLFASGTYRSLATNCITQHQFRQAALYLDTAFNKGDDKYITLLQQFDAAIELGNFSWAASILNQLKDKKAFEYLIRYAKLQDHLGNTEETLKVMEQALLKAEESKNDQLLLWAQSNLADMYSHQNKIKEAYKLYKKVLATDPHYYHALRGIAWIAFSYDYNTELAKKILHTLQLHHPVPDYDYLLAEIAAYENNEEQKNFYTNRFLQAVKNPAYGDMYNKYVFTILSEQKSFAAKALMIAETEVNNRPTPQSYDLLAWAYYQLDKPKEALAIADQKVNNKNFEPEALYHLGLIYKQNGNREKAWNYLNQALNSSFELGPVITNEIKQNLNNL